MPSGAPAEGSQRLGVGEGAVIAFVAYFVYVASSLALYAALPLKLGAGISSILLAATAYFLVWRAIGRPLRYVRVRTLGLRIPIYTILATLAIIPVAASLMAVTISFLEIPEEWLEAAYALVRADNLTELLYVWIVTALLVPVGEEFVFRGVLQNSLSGKFHPVVAVIIASSVFGILHVWRFPAAFVLGLFLGALYAVSGSLLAPVVAHITVNSVVVVGTYLLERAGPRAVPGWVSESGSAPGLVLGVSIAAFAVFMRLIWKEARQGAGWVADSDPGLAGDGL